MFSLTNSMSAIATAIDTFAKRETVASDWRTAEWEQAPIAIVNRSFFSAGVESARFLDSAQTGLAQALDLSRDSAGRLPDREKFIADMRGLSLSLGLGTPDQPANIKNLAGATRLGMIYDMNVDAARGRARRSAGLSEGALYAAPAQELVRGRPARIPRDWRARWAEAGGTLYGSRMIALKTDDVWTNLSRFGVPWPPFDFGSGMVLRNINRADAIALRLIEEDDILEADPDPDFNAGLAASLQGISENVATGLQRLFGNRISIENGTATLAEP
jgi:hypothetical protein